MTEADLRELLVLCKKWQDRHHELAVVADQIQSVLNQHHDRLIAEQRRLRVVGDAS